MISAYLSAHTEIFTALVFDFDSVGRPCGPIQQKNQRAAPDSCKRNPAVPPGYSNLICPRRFVNDQHYTSNPGPRRRILQVLTN
ncbi:hypothetical protein GQ457_15G025210 [Hibiscus cannabinus]